MTHRAVFLDRDGILNEAIIQNGKPYPPRFLEEFSIIPGISERLEKLKKNGFFLIGVTNQPDVSRRITTRDFVNTLNTLILHKLPIDEIFVCFHDDRDGCDCRKPLPGLFYQARDRYGIRLENSYMIGDRWRDIESGTGAGCKTIFVDYGYQEPSPIEAADYSCKSPIEALDWILAREF